MIVKWELGVVILSVAISLSYSALLEPELETLSEWNVLSYDFPWDWPKDDKTYYNPEQVVATGIEIYKDRIFVATPRLFSGVPATISTIPKIPLSSPVLNAYPHWGHHAAGLKNYSCSEIGLVSVYRMKIDSCNRLWALDAGVSRSLEDFEVTCPPKILVFDLNTDEVVRRIDFPAEVIRGESLFTNLIVDETASRPENHCDDVFVYITDTVEPAIVVYDSGNDVTWRLSHPSMFPDPDFAESRIGDDRFTLMDGIVGIAFDRKSGVVYFQPLATDRIFSVSVKALRAGPLPWGTTLPVRLVGRKSSQGIGMTVSKISGSVIFSPLTETAIGSWSPYNDEQNPLVFDDDKLQFVADIKTTEFDPESLYILSSRFHKYFLKNLDQNDINVRIMRIPDTTIPPKSPLKPVQQLSSYYLPIQSHSTGVGYRHHLTHTPPQFYSPGKSPYLYEPVGLINKQVRNPFFDLNTGEKPIFNAPSIASNDLKATLSPPLSFNSPTPTSYQYHVSGDFSGQRFSKSLSNSTLVRHRLS